MKAKEFYEKNRGKYFYHEGEKVRIVGYGDYSILTASETGWNYDKNIKQGIRCIDESLINKKDKLWFTYIECLTPIKQPELDLCKILECCEGMTLYSLTHGYVVLKSIIDRCIYPIVVTTSDGETIDYCKDGRHLSMYKGECMLFPSKENRDWSTFKKLIKEGIPCMCKNSDSDIWVLRTERQASYTYCVPVEYFDFKDIESNISRSIV